MSEINLRISTEGLPQLEAWAASNPDRVRRAGAQFLRLAGQEAVTTMRGVMVERFNRIGVRHPDQLTSRGATGGSVRATMAGDHSAVMIGPSTPYAGFVNDGTAPHFIFPRSARALHWRSSTTRTSKSGKQRRAYADRYAAWVYHPGFRGHHYIEETAVRLGPKLNELAAQVFTRAMNPEGGA